MTAAACPTVKTYGAPVGPCRESQPAWAPSALVIHRILRRSASGFRLRRLPFSAAESRLGHRESTTAARARRWTHDLRGSAAVFSAAQRPDLARLAAGVRPRQPPNSARMCSGV